jgi:hypothetical protein
VPQPKQHTDLIGLIKRGQRVNRNEIRSLALECGFKLKNQGGVMDLHPYVYDFAEKLIERENMSNKQKVEIEIDVPDGYEFDSHRFTKQYEHKNKDIHQQVFVFFKKLKPAKKVIDLSCIVGSGIDCEFFDESEPAPAVTLAEIRCGTDRPYIARLGKVGLVSFKRCRIRQSPHVHYAVETTSCPIPEGLRIRLIWLEDGYVTSTTTTTDYLGFDWRDAIAFEVLGVADNARYEWEEE